MADQIIQGLDELYRALAELPAKIEQNLMRGALRAGGRTFLAEARRGAPVDSGDLRRSLRLSTRSRRGLVTARVTAGGGRKGRQKANRPPVFYASFVEFGTRAHRIAARKGGLLALRGGRFVSAVDHPGAKARPFMRPAFDARWRAAVEATAQYLRARLPGEALKLRRG